MATRTAYAPVAGSVLTAANLAKMSPGWIGYAEVTAGQTPIAAAVDLTGLTVTVTVGTGRRIKITGQVFFSSTVTNDIAGLLILDGATQLNGSQVQLGLTGVGAVTAVASAVVTPTSGSHTYKLQAVRSSGTGVVSTSASSAIPAFILVEDIGSTP